MNPMNCSSTNAKPRAFSALAPPRYATNANAGDLGLRKSAVEFSIHGLKSGIIFNGTRSTHA
jgi:hypothetical protein